MEKIRRNERMTAMMKLLSGTPNRIFTLSSFCELFGAAKSTMSEDIDILRDVVSQFGLGELETVTGAAGGVRYRTKIKRPAARQFISELSQKQPPAAPKADKPQVRRP
jgi:purine operon repressor